MNFTISICSLSSAPTAPFRYCDDDPGIAVGCLKSKSTFQYMFCILRLLFVFCLEIKPSIAGIGKNLMVEKEKS